jgi:hypothetical protein
MRHRKRRLRGLLDRRELGASAPRGGELREAAPQREIGLALRRDGVHVRGDRVQLVQVVRRLAQTGEIEEPAARHLEAPLLAARDVGVGEVGRGDRERRIRERLSARRSAGAATRRRASTVSMICAGSSGLAS